MLLSTKVMNPIFNRTMQRTLEELKEVMRSSFMESGKTQEALADEAQTTQPTIHRWFSYDLSFFPPIYILSFLPESITIPICDFFLKRYGKRVVKPITFTNSKTGKVDKMYSYESIKEAEKRLEGVDVQLEYDMIYNPEYEEVISKFKNIQLRLIKKNKSANG
ncbi:MAG: hypothetical protein WC375_10600 [Methanomassiliicoccales archaeon]